MVYKLKDWPSGDEFMALMPSRLGLSLFLILKTSIHLFGVFNIFSVFSYIYNKFKKPKQVKMQCGRQDSHDIYVMYATFFILNVSEQLDCF